MTAQAVKSTLSEVAERYMNSKCFGVKWYIVDILLFASAVVALM